jgi:serine phosphatase RsbU (regulator of sigma subunit)
MQKNAYEENDKVFLTTLASYVVIALDNAEAYRMLQSQNQHITDSIRYACTIQEAILPQGAELKAWFTDYFVLFQPQNIVSGDFYWFSHVRNAQTDYGFFAVVDCTGHGVPGAFMSMIAYATLNEIVNERDIWAPARILEELDMGIRHALRQEGKASEDGMDLILARIEKTRDGADILAAGAKRNAYVFRATERKMDEISGSKRSIGGMQLKQRDFEQYGAQIQKGDALYLFSDGLPDQLSPNKKKIGTLGLLEFLQSVASLPAEAQKQMLTERLNQHKKDFPQIDDVTVCGLWV